MNGLHLIGDLNGCRCDPQLLLDGKRFEAMCLDLVRASGLTVMDARFHQFEGSGFTGTVVLAESHLAIHTWPENQGLTLDVYVCNFSADNSAKARKLFDDIIGHFQPAEIARHEIDRGEHLLMEPLNESTGFYIKADAPGRRMADQVPEAAGLRHAALRPHLPPRRLQHDLRAGGVRLSREPDPPGAHRARGAEEGADRGRRRRRLLGRSAQAPLGRAGDDVRDRRGRGQDRQGAFLRGAPRRLRQPEAARADRRRHEVHPRDAASAST